MSVKKQVRRAILRIPRAAPFQADRQQGDGTKDCLRGRRERKRKPSRETRQQPHERDRERGEDERQRQKRACKGRHIRTPYGDAEREQENQRAK